MNSEKLTDEQALQNFLLDIDCLDELKQWAEKFNIFDVLKISRTEIRHSNMLAWLFDANENHSIGDRFIKKTAQRIAENDIQGKYDIYQLLLLDFYSFTVYREWNNIDLLIVSDEEKTAFVIENKVGSNEHSNQLDRYREICDNAYPKYNKFYLFLTPQGLPPSDADNWTVFTYNDIIEVLSEITENTEILPDIALMINNYIDVVRRDIVDDQQLIEICNKIYNKHKKALDLIYNNRTDIKSIIRDVVRDTLLQLADRGKIVYDGNYYLRFYSKELDKILPNLENENSVWKTKYPYAYWIYVEETHIGIIFEITSVNVPGETLRKMQTFINILKPKDKRRLDFEYKRLHRINIELKSDDVVGELNKKLSDSIDKLVVWEEKLIKEYMSRTNNEQQRQIMGDRGCKLSQKEKV